MKLVAWRGLVILYQETEAGPSRVKGQPGPQSGPTSKIVTLTGMMSPDSGISSGPPACQLIV